ncbi:hypothetical protein [Rhizobium leguminosarum]|uniref:hypothetical protein n=1 Tax=Rhizobium leguminosarum TaxID=384 RepID=UPI00056BDDD2|nr:hypothetical protein [Rhizobium leguminosarum]
MSDVPDFSEDELAAVREFANRRYVRGADKWVPKLVHLQLWDEARGKLNARGQRIEAVVVGSHDGSQAEISAIGRLIWGKQTREQRIALEQELLDLKLGWVCEKGGVDLTARGQMLLHGLHMSTR